MSFLLDGFITEFFALTSTSQHPFSATSGGSVNSTLSTNSKSIHGIEGLSDENVWYAPAVQSMVAMLILSTIPRIISTIYGWIHPGIYNYIVEKLYVSVIINQDESIYFQIGQYVAEQEELARSKKLRHVQGIAKDNESSRYPRNYFDEEQSTPTPQISLLPRTGSLQIVWHNGQKIWVRREIRKVENGESLGNGLKGLNLDLSSLLQRSQECFNIRSIIQDWLDSIYSRDYNKLTVYQCMRIHYGDYGWKRISNKEMRRYGSVVLRENQKEEILGDVQKFLGSSKKYAMRGIPYRHAVILHGPPGTGKTSFIKGLAEKLKLNIAYISLVASLDDDGFLSMLTRVPANSVIVMEDFDRSHITKDAQESERNGGSGLSGIPRITEAGLLNALDGINTPEGSLIFLTCNNLDKIGRAVKRPGRVDQIYYLTYADNYQIREMFWRFFGKGKQTTDPEARKDNPELQKIANVFLSHIQSLNQNLTTATLQKFFLEYEKEKEIEYWKQKKEQGISKDSSSGSVSINTKDLKENDEKKQHVDHNEQEKEKKEEEEDEYKSIEIDLNLLMDKDYVINLFEKIQMETGVEEKMMEEIAKRKAKEQKKKGKEQRKKEKEEEKDDTEDTEEDTEEDTAVKSDVADTNDVGAPSPPASPLPNGVTSL
ncbi:hypothetical protein INT45_013722 [Circinella minor]|uniref:AAA+ ATPase domain-containing protein n=1 Tax=Circinella minor TaxID=1195481 RepID=A0A8H7SAG8_9FUNG|nr:hypothetical protein INT45_013722 [Circinella minor]